MLPQQDGRPSTTAFVLAPSIDVLVGRVVRLLGGDPDRPTVYEGTPADAASRWAREGADLVHIVDLDAAMGRPSPNAASLADAVRAAQSAGIACEVAGGVRDGAAVARWLAAGADRVVLGTALLREPDLAAALVARHGAGRIVAALDVRGGMAVGEGWRAGAPGTPLATAIDRLMGAGIAIVEVTAIARDGGMAGPDLALLSEVLAIAPRITVLASAGIRDTADLLAVRDLGCAGAIMGRAVYEGAITIAAARAALGG